MATIALSPSETEDHRMARAIVRSAFLEGFRSLDDLHVRLVDRMTSALRLERERAADRVLALAATWEEAGASRSGLRTGADYVLVARKLRAAARVVRAG